MKICRSAFISLWKRKPLRKSTVHDVVHGLWSKTMLGVLAHMKKRNIIFLLASLAATAVGCWLCPLSPAFILAAVVWGVVYLVLRFGFWTPKSEWLPMLAYCLVVIVGYRVSVSWLIHEVRTGSAGDWSLGLLFVGIVGVVVFGYRLLFLITRARHSI